MDESNQDSTQESKQEDKIEFKKPVLFGRVGKLPKRVKDDAERPSEERKDVEKPVEPPPNNSKSSLPPAVLVKELSTPIPYKEPKWSGLCPDGTQYGLEVLKSGMIVENLDLTQKSFFVFGRLANCDVVMAHPTVSRHHAVLQYKAFAEGAEPPCGWYLYDLSSTHGTFLNKERLKPAHYTRVRVGHQIKFGNSTRTYIMQGPDFDCEGESELTVTEIKQKALEMKLNRAEMIREAKERIEREREEQERKREEQGIDWGMGEDAEEEADLSENPYAATANEELYLEDPKKTLRGYFEREGHELSYDCEERGVGQFICRVELPIDDARGHPVVAEVVHKGKKKEAVVACALEACRVLDRAGLLRQAKHESRRRKERDWSADDYYDSDEDSYLDRTGSVERKRSLRMLRHGAGKERERAKTYDELVQEVSELEAQITSEQQTLDRLRARNSVPTANDEQDALDAYMDSLGTLGQTAAQRADISRTKMTIQKLKSELSRGRRLAELARPAHLPPLVKQHDKTIKVAHNSAVYGKRIRLKEDAEKRPKIRQETKQDESEFVEEVDSEEESTEEKIAPSENNMDTTEDNTESLQEKKEVSKSLEEKKEERKSLEEKKEVGKSQESEVKKIYGPMRPPEDYVIPENYFDQESARDLPEIMEKDDDGIV